MAKYVNYVEDPLVVNNKGKKGEKEDKEDGMPSYANKKDLEVKKSRKSLFSFSKKSKGKEKKGRERKEEKEKRRKEERREQKRRKT